MTHRLPIVDFVMRTGDRAASYVLPAIEECRVLYATDMRVRILRANGAQESVDKGRVACIGSAAEWTTVTSLYQAFQHALDDLAKLLASFGRYPTVLHELETIRDVAVTAAKQTAAGTRLRTRPVPAIANPLTPMVIACPDPLLTTAYAWSLPGTNWDLPSVRRTPAARHTKVMLAVGSGDATRDALCSQHGYTVCPSDQAWERVLYALEGATTARTVFLHELDRLLTYRQAEQQRPPRSAIPLAHPDQLTLFEAAA